MIVSEKVMLEGFEGTVSRDAAIEGPMGYAFTNPAAQAPNEGMMFNPRTNARAAMAAFLAEKLEGDL